METRSKPFRIRYKPPIRRFLAQLLALQQKNEVTSTCNTKNVCKRQEPMKRVEWVLKKHVMFSFHELLSTFWEFWTSFCLPSKLLLQLLTICVFCIFSASNEHSIVWKPWKSSNDMLLVMERHQLDIPTGDHCLSPSTPKFCLERFMANQHTPPHSPWNLSFQIWLDGTRSFRNLQRLRLLIREVLGSVRRPGAKQSSRQVSRLVTMEGYGKLGKHDKAISM